MNLGCTPSKKNIKFPNIPKILNSNRLLRLKIIDKINNPINQISSKTNIHKIGNWSPKSLSCLDDLHRSMMLFLHFFLTVFTFSLVPFLSVTLLPYLLNFNFQIIVLLLSSLKVNLLLVDLQ